MQVCQLFFNKLYIYIYIHIYLYIYIYIYIYIYYKYIYYVYIYMYIYYCYYVCYCNTLLTFEMYCDEHLVVDVGSKPWLGLNHTQQRIVFEGIASGYEFSKINTPAVSA